MAKKGYLEASQMAHTFDAIRANDLVFQYVVNNWLIGEKPPAFDLLAWNNDSTRMPAKMHSAYLRSCYLRNEFSTRRARHRRRRARSRARCRSTPTCCRRSTTTSCRGSRAYKTAQPARWRQSFVLSTSGHIAGIVNPPSPKAKHWTNDGPSLAIPSNGTRARRCTTTRGGTTGCRGSALARATSVRGRRIARIGRLPAARRRTGDLRRRALAAVTRVT